MTEMATEYVSEVPITGPPSVYYVDMGVYGIEGYAAVYIIDAEEPTIIDTGIGRNPERLINAVTELGIAPGDVSYILPTHVHLDHAGGTGHFAEEFQNATAGVHELGASHLIDPSGLVKGTKRAIGDGMWEWYGDPIPVPEDRIEMLTGGERLNLGNYALDVHHAPGHAPHQVVFESVDNRSVFAADAAGNWFPDLGFLRALSPPPDFDLEQCIEDIEMLRSLNPEILCYAHFGPAQTADKLETFEEILRAWVDAIERKRSELSDDEAVIDYFASRNGVTHLRPERRAYQDTAMNVRGVLHYLDQRKET